MKTPALQFTLILVGGLFLAGCGDGKIPVDQEQARPFVISVKQAKEYTNSFEQGRADLAVRLRDSSFLRDSFNLPNAEMFSRHAIALLLNAEGAEGVRVYLGRDAKGQVRLVLLPVDKNGKNIIGRLISNSTVFIPGVSSAYAQGNEGEAIENGQRCPTMCDEGW
ncbi:MAG TPA: hypothetical protein VGD17_05520 [Chitinophagaceae bacterium]